MPAGRPTQQYPINYSQLAEMTGKSIATIRKHAERHNIDLENMESLVLFIARHGNVELKRRILDYMLTRELTERPGERKRPKRAKTST